MSSVQLFARPLGAYYQIPVPVPTLVTKMPLDAYLSRDGWMGSEVRFARPLGAARQIPVPVPTLVSVGRDLTVS